MKHSHGMQAGKSRCLKPRMVSVAEQLKEFKVGETARIAINPRFRGYPPLKFNNRTIKIMGRQGGAYVVEMKDLHKTKTLVVNGSHLMRVG
jgi:ribosomal protein L21E